MTKKKIQSGNLNFDIEGREFSFPTREGDIALASETNRYVGTRTIPGITYSSPNIIVDGTGVYSVFATADYEGTVREISPAGATLEITDEDITYYLYADWNGGSPILAVSSDPAVITPSNTATIARVIRTGTVFHTSFYNRKSRGLPEKIQQYLERIDGFKRIEGLIPSVVGTRNLSITDGIVALGGVSSSVAALDTSVSDTILFVTWDGAAWVTSLDPQLNNTQYQTPSGLASLSSNRYAVNWVWRGVEDQPHIYVLLGEGNYRLDEANAAPVTTPPAWVSDHAILVGRVIFQEGNNTPTSVATVLEPSFATFIANEHNSLAGIQGGITAEHYHATAAEHTAIQLLATSPYEVKPADTSRASTAVLANDPDLAGFVLLPATFYTIEGYLDVESASVLPDIQWAFTETTASQNGSYVYSIIDGAGTSTSDRVLFTDTVIGDLAAATPAGVNIRGFLYTNATTGPTVNFQWAQDTSDATATVLGQGSWIRFTRL